MVTARRTTARKTTAQRTTARKTSVYGSEIAAYNAGYKRGHKACKAGY